MAAFDTEREGQMEFYRTFLPNVDPSISLEDILADNNDGVLNGNLLEFKLRISDLNATLFQAIKYLSSRRIKGKAVPANILLVDLNGETAYLYRSQDYLADIEMVYCGAASKNDVGFAGGPYGSKLVYSKQLDASKLVDVLRESSFTRVNIDENCIVGWATRFYQEKPNARKEDFIGDSTGKHRTIGEIRNPTLFADFILPYKGESNRRFSYLMDKLNDFIQQKDLGAFYTPPEYARKSHELLRQAIARVPDGNDYVIVDRCAGTANLEEGLTDEELSHCILSTLEYYEYKVMQELVGSKVRHIIPPIEASDTFDAGRVRGADALAREYVENDVIMQYVRNPNCTIILFENPPYAETTSLEHQKKGAGKSSSSQWKKSWVVEQMRAAIRKDKGIPGTAVNDMGNSFIWSGFEYYLRQPTDSYVLFSPIKYWKAQNLVNKRLIGGFCGDRHHFHALKHTCVAVTLWSNEDASLEDFELEGFDIDDGELVSVGMLPMRRTGSSYSKTYFDKRQIDEEHRKGILCGLNGLEKIGFTTKRNSPARGGDVIGYMAVYSSGFDNPDAHSSLLVGGRYDGNGFYLRKDNYLEKLPMFAASRYISYNGAWTDRGRIMKSGDGAERFNADVATGMLDQWMRRCLLFTCLEMQNHMRSFTGSDGWPYRNELCLDVTNGETVASRDLGSLSTNASEEALIGQWEVLLAEVRRTPEYDPSLTYGVYQINEEIDVSHKDEEGNTVWDNLEVHSALQTLKKQVKQYYLDAIVPTLFEYEFLK